MKRIAFPAVLLCLALVLTACGAAPQQTPSSGSGSSQEETVTLESLCGSDYQTYLVDTITMQMENRMEKTPEVSYFPIAQDKPLTDFVAIDETTSFHQDETGNLILVFPAGTLTDEAYGEQSFKVALP